MRYSDNVTCEQCRRAMRGKGVELDHQGREFIACEYCGARYEVVRQQRHEGGRVKLLSGPRLSS